MTGTALSSKACNIPGLGLNAYFAYNVVGYLGSGNVSYGAALTDVFIEGWIFLLLSVTGARAKLITFVPRSIALAMSAGASHGKLERLMWAVRVAQGSERACLRASWRASWGTFK